MKSRIQRRIAFTVAAVVLAAGSLAACSSGGNDKGPITVSMWVRDGDKAGPAQINAFEKTHPDIKVKVSKVVDAQYLTKLANAIRAGSAPDLIDFDVINAPLLATQKQLVDITSRAKKMSNYGSLVKSGIEAGSLGKTIYSLPVAVNDSQMFWNKDLFKKAGLDPDKAPTSLAEVKSDAEQIQKLGGGVHGFSTIGGTGQSFTALPIVWADGGDYFTAPGKDQKSLFNSKPVAGMVDWFASMWKAGVMPPTDEPNQDPGNVGAQNAVSGKVGIVFTGANTLAGHENMFGSTAGIPGNSGKLTTEAGGNQIAISAGSKHPDQAWTVLNWLVTNKTAATINLKNGWIAPDLDVASQLATTEWSRKTVDALKNGHLPLSIAYSSVVKDENGPWTQASQAIIFQGADTASNLKHAQQVANQLIADAYQQVG